MSARNKHHLRKAFGVICGTLPFIYLGVPISIGASKSRFLKPIADRLVSKFSKWKRNTLSLAGSICLVNSVITDSLVHTMMVYKWPSMLKSIQTAMRNFIGLGIFLGKVTSMLLGLNVVLLRGRGSRF